MKNLLKSPRIEYVQVNMNLLDDYLILVNDYEHVGKFIGRDNTTIDANKEANWVNSKINENAIIFSMIEKSTNEFIGNIELMDSNSTQGELGIAITKKKQNLGYGKEAISTFLDYCFNDLKLERVFLKAFPFNSRAIHVYEECGFTKYDQNETSIFMQILKKDL